MKKHPSMEAVFTVWNNGNSTSGSMTVAGSKFRLSTPEMKIWFDGKTQWAYSPAAREVNITEPTAEEIAQSNPLAILGAIDRSCSMRRLNANAGLEKLELVPKRKSADFSKVILTIDKASAMPKEIKVFDSKGAATTVKISSIKPGKALPLSAFRYNASAHKGVEVVDLR